MYLHDRSAHEVAESKQRKTIVAADVIKALEMIEFGDMTETLNNELVSKCRSVLTQLVIEAEEAYSLPRNSKIT